MSGPIEMMAREMAGLGKGIEREYVWADETVHHYWEDRVRAALIVAERAGYALIPLEATDDMALAVKGTVAPYQALGNVRALYRDMLAARPPITDAVTPR